MILIKSTPERKLKFGGQLLKARQFIERTERRRVLDFSDFVFFVLKSEHSLKSYDHRNFGQI